MKTESSSLDFVGLGPYGSGGLTADAREALADADIVFAEFYTTYPGPNAIMELERMIGKIIHILDRTEVECGAVILHEAGRGRVVFLTGGDTMSATTHVELRVEAHRRGIPSRIYHAPSVLTAVPSELGLSHYKFGRVTTLVFPRKNFFPTSPYDVIGSNRKAGLHTLVLLDIVTSEDMDSEEFSTGLEGMEIKNVNGSAAMMSSNEGFHLLYRMEKMLGRGVMPPERIVCSVARAGSRETVVRCGCLKDLMNAELGELPHSIVVPGKLHFMEKKSLCELAGAREEIFGKPAGEKQ